MPIRSGRVLTSHFRSSWDHVFDNVEERWGRIRIVQFVAREALGICAHWATYKAASFGLCCRQRIPKPSFLLRDSA